MENELCTCENNNSVYTVNGEWGYWLYCTECEKKIEDGFHYYDEPEDVY